MRKNLYITSSGKLSRKENTLFFENQNQKKVIPIIGIENIYCIGEVSINSQLLTHLSQNKIVCHFFNYYGYYTGSFYPKESYLSGRLLIKQVEHYTDLQKRLIIAKKIVSAIGLNHIEVLNSYYKHSQISSKLITSIKKVTKRVDIETSIKKILQAEGEIWMIFYAAVSQILLEGFDFRTRVKRPPDNPINALISFGNSLLYSKVTAKIYHTQLNPTISYLHEPGERRFSLSLDIAEVFKSEIVFQTIFKLINKKVLKADHFNQELNFCLLNEQGRRVFVEEFEKKISETREHPTLKRKYSLDGLIKLELYKLSKHLLEEKEYIPYLTSNKY